MKIIKDHSHLKIILDQDLNLFNVKRILRLAQDFEKVHIDLKHARLIDSEGLILFYRLIKAGKQLSISNPPKILFQIADLLEFDEVIDLKKYIADSV